MEDFKQRVTEDSYMRQEEVTFADCDEQQRIRMAVLLSKAALFGGYDYDAKGLPRAKLLELGIAFLLSRIAVRIHRCPRMGDILTITTWEDGTKGAHMQRVYEMVDREGNLCASVRSEWILANPETHTLLRPSAFTARPFGSCPKEIDCPAPRKILLPKDGQEDWGIRAVRWSDLDGNGHLYSGKYGDIIWDALPEALQKRTPVEFQINYKKEARLGQTLQLTGVQRESGCTVAGAVGEAACFSAEILFEE